MTVKGYKNIYESFDSYTAEEILDNEDKYETEKYGKQKAKKGIKFISFPPVLFLQLKRFEYNSKKDIMVIALAPHSMPLLEGGDKAVQRMFEFIEK